MLTALKREPLEYLTAGVGLKKKNRNFSNDRSESPVALPSPPRFFLSRDLRPFVQSPMAMKLGASTCSALDQGPPELAMPNANGMAVLSSSTIVAYLVASPKKRARYEQHRVSSQHRLARFAQVEETGSVVVLAKASPTSDYNALESMKVQNLQQSSTLNPLLQQQQPRQRQHH